MSTAADKANVDEGMMTITEAMRFLSLSRTSLYKLRQQGEPVEARLLDRAVRLTRASVRRYAEERRR